jgi:hypothetical protein
MGVANQGHSPNFLLEFFGRAQPFRTSGGIGAGCLLVLSAHYSLLTAHCPLLFSVLYFRPMSEQPCEPPQMPLDNDLLDPYERLVGIEVLGKHVEVPERNRLLRCFQFLSLKTISYGDFCWNGECTNCQIWYHTEGESKVDDKPALACRLEVIEGMTITSMTPYIKLDGITDKKGE